MFVFLFLLSAVVVVVNGKEISFENCGGHVISVDVEPCAEEPCEFPKGTAPAIRVKCRSNANADKLRLTVWADVAGMEMPYPGMKRDACKGKNLTCPITQDQEFSYLQIFQVKNFFPTIDTHTRFNLATNDGQDKVVCCFRAPVKVVAKQNTTIAQPQ